MHPTTDGVHYTVYPAQLASGCSAPRYEPIPFIEYTTTKLLKLVVRTTIQGSQRRQLNLCNYTNGGTVKKNFIFILVQGADHYSFLRLARQTCMRSLQALSGALMWRAVISSTRSGEVIKQSEADKLQIASAYRFPPLKSKLIKL